ncbi:DNA-binding protein [Parabacteroides gordonii]|jgi:nucleoid DNA-binding protein|uniref:HU family DNA-binding protein n=1 Tax=Parabacteroides gordonii TaxID=574930 RepID=UPI0026E99831|nr:DNA-binding protein [Parabacteroides gordonii]
MSAHYDLYETPSPKGEEGKKSLHARVCPKKTYTQEEFIDYVTRFQHLPKSQLVGALDAFIEGLRYLLAEGNIVEMGDLGFFSTSLKCLKETDDEENKIGSKSVVFQNVHLRISREFRKKMTKEMKFERVHSLTRKQKKITTTVEERMKRLANFLKLNICITRKEYIGVTGLTPYEAMNELNSFISQGILRRRGSGRSAVYVSGEKLLAE